MRQDWRKGPWTPEEDELLKEYVKSHGDSNGVQWLSSRVSSLAFMSDAARFLGKMGVLMDAAFLRQNKQDHCQAFEEARDENPNGEQGYDSSSVEDPRFPLETWYPKIPYWPNLVVRDDLMLWAGRLRNFDDDLVLNKRDV
ncbi:hypothetical protein MLD38_033857 [Melastoma candidum]|uniref:Uncharacterized protein n=1 Tax=Melastoma candidum TaxID=119954 RepID=A0ACB9M9X9_9MYRT|nr:hypothetical protein MLD38_033857 [Melastoma candidum]